MTREEAIEKGVAAIQAVMPPGWICERPAVEQHVAMLEALGLLKFEPARRPDLIDASGWAEAAFEPYYTGVDFARVMERLGRGVAFPRRG